MEVRGPDRKPVAHQSIDTEHHCIPEVPIRKRSVLSVSLPPLGWSVFEGRDRFKDGSPGPGRLIWPVARYDHADGCSITGGYVYRGSTIPGLHGTYLYGDFCSARVFALQRDAAPPHAVRTMEISERIESTTLIAQLSSFGEDEAGELYVVSLAGTVYRIDPR